MSRQRNHLSRMAASGLVLVAICVSACSKSHDAMIDLSDRIETESETLLLGQKETSSFVQHLEADTPWIIILIPSGGFDEAAALRAGVPESLRREVGLRVPEWKGAALIVYAAPRRTSITKLPDKVAVREQAIARGDSASTGIAVALARRGELVSITSVSAVQPTSR